MILDTDLDTQSTRLKMLLPRIVSILSRYYFEIEQNLPIYDFVLPPNPELKSMGRVLIDEVPEFGSDIFLGIEFGTELFKDRFVSVHDLAVVTEEVSHFLLLYSAASSGRQVSEVDLETLGEIDRFLVLLHWNAFNPDCEISLDCLNLLDLCDVLFVGQRFVGDVRPIYFTAETIALKQLRFIFAETWDASVVDRFSISETARQRLNQFRTRVLLPRRLAAAS